MDVLVHADDGGVEDVRVLEELAPHQHAVVFGEVAYRALQRGLDVGQLAVDVPVPFAHHPGGGFTLNLQLAAGHVHEIAGFVVPPQVQRPHDARARGFGAVQQGFQPAGAHQHVVVDEHGIGRADLRRDGAPRLLGPQAGGQRQQHQAGCAVGQRLQRLPQRGRQAGVQHPHRHVGRGARQQPLDHGLRPAPAFAEAHDDGGGGAGQGGGGHGGADGHRSLGTECKGWVSRFCAARQTCTQSLMCSSPM